jgi:dienelactone hydrolase
MSFNGPTIPSGGVQLPSKLYSPSGTGPGGLVVLAYGTDGFVDNGHGPWQTMMCGYAQELANAGFAALIPDYFAKTGTPHGGAAASSIVQHHDDWSTALVDTVAYSRTLATVDPSRIGMVGFSLGGYLCLRSRAAAKPKALVEYFAPVFEGIGAKGSVPHVQIHHGTLDTGPTAFSNATQIEGLLKLEGPDVTLYAYKNATHGFAGKDPANTSAAALSKSRTISFFTTCM